MTDESVSYISEQARALGEALRQGGGGGTSGGMDGWQQSVEKRLDQLNDSVRRLDDRADSNFKWLIGSMAGMFALGLAAIVSTYLMLADKIDTLPR